MKEVWKDVSGFEGIYEVSNFGRVKSCERVIMRSNGRPMNFPEKVMTPSVNHKGYEIIDMQNHGKRSGGFVHRLVAKAFIPNPENKKTVNHKDGNKRNNHVDNLEWMTNLENMRHGFEKGLLTNKYASESRKRKVAQIGTEGVVVNVFDSIQEAEDITKIYNISAVCRGVRPRAGGYQWKYVDDKENDK